MVTQVPPTTRALPSIDTIVIHCADTPNGVKHTAVEIDDWHRARNFRRAKAALELQSPQLKYIGYHAVIEIAGNVVLGRDLSEVGAHVEGNNRNTVGVCMIGRDRFTREQWHALRDLVAKWEQAMPIERIAGHREFNRLKTCPGFSVAQWLADGRWPSLDHICNPKETSPK